MSNAFIVSLFVAFNITVAMWFVSAMSSCGGVVIGAMHAS